MRKNCENRIEGELPNCGSACGEAAGYRQAVMSKADPSFEDLLKRTNFARAERNGSDVRRIDIVFQICCCVIRIVLIGSLNGMRVGNTSNVSQKSRIVDLVVIAVHIVSF
jgi:hypothetical protein